MEASAISTAWTCNPGSSAYEWEEQAVQGAAAPLASYSQLIQDPCSVQSIRSRGPFGSLYAAAAHQGGILGGELLFASEEVVHERQQDAPGQASWQPLKDDAYVRRRTEQHPNFPQVQRLLVGKALQALILLLHPSAELKSI